MVLVLCFTSLGGVGAFSALREQTGGASLWRGASKVAHRIWKERRLCLIFFGFGFFSMSGFQKARLLESDGLSALWMEMKGRFFLLKLGGTA